MADNPLVIAGAFQWTQAVQEKLGQGYSIKQYAQPSPGYIARLTDDHAALILVDAADKDWRFWTTTPKTSPATRRIPIFLISPDAALKADGLIAGADLVLSPDELLNDLPSYVADYARVLDQAKIEQLDCECDEPLPPLAVQGVEKFNAGAYYPQHDLFEEQWVKTSTPVRDLYRAILQVGVAYYQIERGNFRGAHKMLLRSVQWLTILPDVCQGVDIAQLRQDSYRVRAELERLGEARIGEFDRSLLKPLVVKSH